jgi:SAM-dependent methyltransferase
MIPRHTGAPEDLRHDVRCNPAQTTRVTPGPDPEVTELHLVPTPEYLRRACHDGRMEADRDRWDVRWSAAGVESDQAAPVAPDVVDAHPELLEQLPTDGIALDLACGIGAQSLWMAARGLTVSALDVSPVAVDLAARSAAQHGFAVDAAVWDTDEGLPADLNGLAMIVCQRYRASDLYLDFVQRLRPGGVLILTVLSAVGLDATAGPFHAPAGELTNAYRWGATAGTIAVLVDDEHDGQASIVVRRRHG